MVCYTRYSNILIPNPHKILYICCSNSADGGIQKSRSYGTVINPAHHTGTKNTIHATRQSPSPTPTIPAPAPRQAIFTPAEKNLFPNRTAARKIPSDKFIRAGVFMATFCCPPPAGVARYEPGVGTRSGQKNKEYGNLLATIFGNYIQFYTMSYIA